MGDLPKSGAPLRVLEREWRAMLIEPATINGKLFGITRKEKKIKRDLFYSYSYTVLYSWSFSRCKPLLAVNYGLGLLFRVPHYLVGWNDGIVEVYGMRLALMKKDKMLDYCGHAQLSSEFRCHAEDMKYPVVSTSCQVRDRLLGGLKDDLIQWVDKSNTKPGMCASNWPSSSFP